MSAMLAHAVLESHPAREIKAAMNTSYAADLWLGTLTGKHYSQRSVATYRRLLYKFADEHPPHKDIRDLTRVDVRAFLDRQQYRQDGTIKSAATIAQNVTIINRFFDWLSADGLIPRNPTRNNGDRVISRPKQVPADDNPNVVTISADDVKALLNAAERGGRWDELLTIYCLAYLGPRRKALASARIGDYNLNAQKLTFREKGGKVIHKPVPDRLAQLIETAILCGVYRQIEDYLIPARSTQRRPGDRDDRIIWHIVRNVAKSARVTTHVHALRAAFAAHFLTEKPGELIALQKLMGHARIDTTMVYLRRLDRDQAMETVRDLAW